MRLQVVEMVADPQRVGPVRGGLAGWRQRRGAEAAARERDADGVGAVRLGLPTSAARLS